LIWNKNKLAELKISELNTKYANENWLLALSATLPFINLKESINTIRLLKR
jgi:hypothetical protein